MNHELNAIVNGCDPKIRGFVRYLRERGFDTTDSGDGETKRDDIMRGEALDYPHVFCRCPPERLLQEADRMRSLVARAWTVEASYKPGEEIGIIACYRNDLLPDVWAQSEQHAQEEFDHDQFSERNKAQCIAQVMSEREKRGQ